MAMFEVGKAYNLKNTTDMATVIAERPDDGTFWAMPHNNWNVAYRYERDGLCIKNAELDLIPPKPPVVVSDAVRKAYMEDNGDLEACIAAAIAVWRDEQE